VLPSGIGPKSAYKVPVPSSHVVQDGQVAEHQPGARPVPAALLRDEGLPKTHKHIEMWMCYGAGVALAGEQTVQSYCQRLAGALGGFGLHSERWNEFELPKLSSRELLALAKLLGCPSCGSKETVIVHLLAQRELRLKLAPFTGNPEELAICYKRESLRDVCREAGIWRSGNKRALSAGLLNWRDRCRARGQEFLAEMRSLAKDRPQQLSLRFEVLS
jgi:hypothetical protein